MPISNDPLNRYWVEAAESNPALVDNFRSTLFGFLAFNAARQASFVGSGFIIAATREFALVLTAKHVICDGVLRIQRPVPRYHPSSIFVSPNSTKPLLEPSVLKAVWAGEHHAKMMNVAHAAYNDTLDLASCVIVSQGNEPYTFDPAAIPMDTAVPRIGEPVWQVSLDKMTIEEIVAPVDRSGSGHHIVVGVVSASESVS